MTKSDDRKRAGAYRFLQTLKYPSALGIKDDIDRVLRRDRRVRREALKDAIVELGAMILEGAPDEAGIQRAIDALFEMRKRVAP